MSYYSSARMFASLGICVPRLLYAGLPACELRNLVMALAHVFATSGVCVPRLFHTRLPGRELQTGRPDGLHTSSLTS